LFVVEKLQARGAAEVFVPCIEAYDLKEAMHSEAVSLQAVKDR
jgi:hypothetical protein